MKKRIILVSLVIMVALLMYRWMPVLYVYYVNIWSEAVEYTTYKKEFNLVKDFILTEYGDEEDKYVSVSLGDEKGIGLYDPDKNAFVKCEDEVREALRTIENKAFMNNPLDVIRIRGNRVSFCIENGHYALVYSPDEKPTNMYGTDNGDDVLVKKAGKDWYHVVINPH